MHGTPVVNARERDAGRRRTGRGNGCDNRRSGWFSWRRRRYRRRAGRCRRLCGRQCDAEQRGAAATDPEPDPAAAAAARAAASTDPANQATAGNRMNLISCQALAIQTTVKNPAPSRSFRLNRGKPHATSPDEARKGALPGRVRRVCRMNQIAHYHAESEGVARKILALLEALSSHRVTALPRHRSGCRLGAFNFRSFDESIRTIRAGEVTPGGVTRSPTAVTWLVTRHTRARASGSLEWGSTRNFEFESR
jgi:hypothetical protein